MHTNYYPFSMYAMPPKIPAASCDTHITHPRRLEGNLPWHGIWGLAGASWFPDDVPQGMCIIGKASSGSTGGSGDGSQ